MDRETRLGRISRLRFRPRRSGETHLRAGAGPRALVVPQWRGWNVGRWPRGHPTCDDPSRDRCAPGSEGWYRQGTFRARSQAFRGRHDRLALAPGVPPPVAPMPVATNLFAPGSSRDGQRLLFVGRLTEQKGVEHLLHALASMKTPAAHL